MEGFLSEEVLFCSKVFMDILNFGYVDFQLLSTKGKVLPRK